MSNYVLIHNGWLTHIEKLRFSSNFASTEIYLSKFVKFKIAFYYKT